MSAAAALIRWREPGTSDELAELECAIEAAIDRGDHDFAAAGIALLDEISGDCDFEDDADEY